MVVCILELVGLFVGMFVFDVNVSCLSFFMVLYVVSSLLIMGVYKCIVVVVFDLVLCGIDWDDVEIVLIFGDGVVVVIVEVVFMVFGMGIYVYCMEIYFVGKVYCEICVGGMCCNLCIGV